MPYRFPASFLLTNIAAPLLVANIPIVREHSQHSWEVTQANELLHQMENFKGVMVGATNFSANLDAAILRRFTSKIEVRLPRRRG